MESNKYYTILGLKKNDNPNPDQIKKAYKKAALKWHPDRNAKNKNKAEEKFKEINQAYEILSDPEKKQQYDLYGENIPTQGIPFNPNHNFNDPFDLFNRVFQSDRQGFSFHTFPMSPMTPMSPMSPMTPSQKTYKYEIKLTLKELFTGCLKKMKVTSNIIDGLSGKIIPVSKIYDIKVKPGWKSGTKITYNSDNNLIIFIIKEIPHKYLIRKDNDLHWTCHLSPDQLKKGVKLTLNTPKPNEKIEFSTSNKIIRDGDQVNITGKGMPIKNTNDRGNLIINFTIKKI